MTKIAQMARSNEPKEIILPGPPPLKVTLRRLASARRLTLRVSAQSKAATLTLPTRLPLSEALTFLESREGWLRQHGAGSPPPTSDLRFGATLPLYGQARTLAPHDAKGVRLEGNTLYASATRPLGASLAAFLRALARDHLTESADHYATLLGRPYRGLSLRDTRSRWGSCTSAGDLMFNWRLVMAPPAVLNYVAAHEVAHLQEMNHSRAFWAVVSTLDPNWRASQSWLKTEGHKLMQIRFSD